MRRILLVLAAAAIMAAMMVLSAVPAFAQEFETKDDKTETPLSETKDDKFERTIDPAGPLLIDFERKDDKRENTATFGDVVISTAECDSPVPTEGETCEVKTGSELA